MKLLEIPRAGFCDWRELKILFSYIAAHLLFLNAQRPASIQNMPVQEFKYHVETADGQYCIKVARHKSARKHGPVKLVFSKKILDLMAFYFQNIHNKIVPKKPFQNRFSLKDTGDEFTSISATVKCVGKLFGCNLPYATLQRKRVTSKGSKTKSEKELLMYSHNIMLHTPSTSQKHYQHPDLECHTNSKKVIEQLTFTE